MLALTQLRHLGFASSSTWVLLLLSLYFSWICPAESHVAPLPGLGLVTTQQVSSAAVWIFSNFSKTKEPLIVATFSSVYAVLHDQALALEKKRENLLPASNVILQWQAHRPRSAFALS